MDKLRAAATKMQNEMTKLNVAAETGNIDAIKAAVGDTGKACKACHDRYRKE
jgi:cytochrome c556